DEHSSGEGQDGEELESVRGVEEEEARRGEAQDQQQVADHHVREESDRERERLRDELRDEFDRDEQDVHGRRYAGQNECVLEVAPQTLLGDAQDRKSTRLNSSHVSISYAVFCLKKKRKYERS